ncbi:hypothetical protein KY330_04325 [Candidatus Woesearchaeota archaeon]|nr:hypothetical protein [Candidatus Woesearchaeota archaeon]
MSSKLSIKGNRKDDLLEDALSDSFFEFKEKKPEEAKKRKSEDNVVKPEAKKDKDLEEKVAYRNHIVCDQGNGGSYCSNCQYFLGSDPSIGYDRCPNCNYKLKEGSLSYA